MSCIPRVLGGARVGRQAGCSALGILREGLLYSYSGLLHRQSAQAEADGFVGAQMCKGQLGGRTDVGVHTHRHHTCKHKHVHTVHVTLGMDS